MIFDTQMKGSADLMDVERTSQRVCRWSVALCLLIFVFLNLILFLMQEIDTQTHEERLIGLEGHRARGQLLTEELGEPRPRDGHKYLQWTT